MKYQHWLYEYAPLHAAQDSLRSTHSFVTLQCKVVAAAGDALVEVQKLWYCIMKKRLHHWRHGWFLS